MSVVTNLPYEMGAPAGLFAYAALRGSESKSRGTIRLTEYGPDILPAEAQWAAQVAAICDLQDQKAFVALFQHFAPRVKGFLIKSGATDTLAEECSQEVMATLWRKAHMYDPSRASVATWIFTIARNKRIDMLRKQRRAEPEDLPWGHEAQPEPSDIISMQQDSARLTKALASLPEKQRILVERAYFQDLSHSEIAAETGLPLGTIKSRIRLALERLRHTMK